jgi:hypothetical protein
MDFLAFGGQADSHRPAVDARVGVMQIAGFNQLLDVIGDIRPEIVAARTQFAGRQLLIVDIIKLIL